MGKVLPGPVEQALPDQGEARNSDDDRLGVERLRDPERRQALPGGAGHDHPAPGLGGEMLLRCLDRCLLVRPGRPRLQLGSLALDLGLDPLPVLIRQPQPSVEADLGRVPEVLVLADRLGTGVGDNGERDVLAGNEGKAGERGQFTVGQRLLGVRPELALNRPELAIVGPGQQVNAFVGGRQIEPLANPGRDFLRHPPDVFQLRPVLGVRLEVELGDPLECFAGVDFRAGGQRRPQCCPVRAANDEAVDPVHGLAMQTSRGL